MTTPILEAKDVVVAFPEAGRVLDGVSLQVHAGETVALVGASGCGKTTLARCLLGLQPVHSGQIHIGGINLATANHRDMKRIRRCMQAVFQDPGGSLNERMRVGEIVGEPLRVLRGVSGSGLRTAVAELLEAVGLDAADADSFPHRFSGGQKQRIAIARALSVEPDVLVCDEPTSALDVSVQARVLNLLGDLQRDRGMAMLMVTHDLAVAACTCDRIAVLQDGQVVEDRPTRALLDAPMHAASTALVNASS